MGIRISIFPLPTSHTNWYTTIKYTPPVAVLHSHRPLPSSAAIKHCRQLPAAAACLGLPPSIAGVVFIGEAVLPRSEKGWRGESCVGAGCRCPRWPAATFVGCCRGHRRAQAVLPDCRCGCYWQGSGGVQQEVAAMHERSAMRGRWDAAK
jgi:hypothetical protein